MWVVFGILNLTGGSLKKLILRFSAYQRASEVMLERKPCKSTWSWVETRTRNKRVVFSDVFVYQISTYVLSTLSKTSQNASETKIWLWQNEELVSQSPFFGVGQVMLVSGRVIQGFDPPPDRPHIVNCDGLVFGKPTQLQKLHTNFGVLLDNQYFMESKAGFLWFICCLP